MMEMRMILVAGLVLVGCSTSKQSTIPQTTSQQVDHVRELSQQGTDAVLWQYASAEAHRLFQQGFELARIRLAENLLKNDGRVPAVVVDIDETVLDNSPYEIDLIHQRQVYEPDSWKAWTDKASAKALPGAIDFLQDAKTQGCEVFYISNRHLSEGESTMQNLADLGFPFADKEHLLLMDEVSDKTERRAAVAKDHRIVLLIGDQLRDFDERFKDRSVDHGKPIVDAMADTLRQYFILLPNPMYGTFRDAVHGKGTPEEKFDRVRGFFKEHAY